MIEIKDLLLKFSNLLVSEETKKATIAQVFKETIGLQIESKDIKIKNNILYLNIKPIYKNEILLKRDKINLELEKSLGKKAPQNII
jgi:hypothetical protein